MWGAYGGAEIGFSGPRTNNLTFPGGVEPEPQQLTSPDGQILAISNSDGSATLREAPTGRILGKLSPDGRTVLTEAALGQWSLWDARNGAYLGVASELEDGYRINPGSGEAYEPQNSARVDALVGALSGAGEPQGTEPLAINDLFGMLDRDGSGQLTREQFRQSFQSIVPQADAGTAELPEEMQARLQELNAMSQDEIAALAQPMFGDYQTMTMQAIQGCQPLQAFAPPQSAIDPRLGPTAQAPAPSQSFTSGPGTGLWDSRSTGQHPQPRSQLPTQYIQQQQQQQQQQPQQQFQQQSPQALLPPVQAGPWQTLAPQAQALATGTPPVATIPPSGYGGDPQAFPTMPPARMQEMMSASGRSTEQPAGGYSSFLVR